MTEYMSNYDRMLKACMAEYEAVIKERVEREFGPIFDREQPGDEIPIIGGEFPPLEYRDEDLKQKAIRALCAVRWFELEAPLWAQPLPLRQEEFEAVNRLPDQRRRPVAFYGRILRGQGWNLKYAQPFEKFLAYQIVPMN
jgi:hypothetical protein